MADMSAAVTLGARVRSSMIFIAIVWTIAASFVAFEELALGVTEFFRDHPSLAGPQLANATKRSTSCQLQPDEVRAPPTLEPHQARLQAWFLGIATGQSAVETQRIDGPRPDIASRVARVRDEAARALGVAAPAPFIPNQLANANNEFIERIEADSGGTAHAVALRHSEAACYLYKFAAFWGYSRMILATLPGRRVCFASELQHYAPLAALPPELWSPMVDAVPRDTTEQVTNSLRELAARANSEVHPAQVGVAR